MRRYELVSILEAYRPSLLNSWAAKLAGEELAEDCVQEAFIAVLNSDERHTLVEDAEVKELAHRLFRNKVGAATSKRARHGKYVQSLDRVTHYEGEGDKREGSTDEGGGVGFLERYRTEFEEMECPFCFNGPLNKHGACGLCETIIGKSFRISNSLTLEQVTEVDFDKDLVLDVQKAIAMLPDFERLVVSQVMYGETLEGLSGLTDRTRQTLWRTWVRAKENLKMILEGYAPKEIPTATRKSRMTA